MNEWPGWGYIGFTNESCNNLPKTVYVDYWNIPYQQFASSYKLYMYIQFDSGLLYASFMYLYGTSCMLVLCISMELVVC